jgi:hypothetical protein
MLQMLQRMPAGKGRQARWFYSMRVDGVVCAPHNRHRSVAVIAVVVVVVVTIMVAVMVVAGVVVHDHSSALVYRHDTTAKGQGADHDSEGDDNGGYESTHGIVPSSWS